MTLIEYIDLIEKNALGRFYRGQADHEWRLEPSLARLDFRGQDALYGSWRDLEMAILSDFKRHATPYISSKPEDELEWIMYAQHYGVPSRLLDWTTNPLKALFFAVSDTNNESSDGAVYSLVPSETTYDPLRDAQENTKSVVAFYPLHINERIAAQECCFTLCPLPPKGGKFLELKEGCNQAHNVLLLTKLIIPQNSKQSLRKELSRYGVSFKTIFPGLSGIAKSICQTYPKRIDLKRS